MSSNGAKFSKESFILIFYGVFSSYCPGQCIITNNNALERSIEMGSHQEYLGSGLLC